MLLEAINYSTGRNNVIQLIAIIIFHGKQYNDLSESYRCKYLLYVQIPFQNQLYTYII